MTPDGRRNDRNLDDIRDTRVINSSSEFFQHFGYEDTSSLCIGGDFKKKLGYPIQSRESKCSQ